MTREREIWKERGEEREKRRKGGKETRGEEMRRAKNDFVKCHEKVNLLVNSRYFRDSTCKFPTCKFTS